MRYDYPLDAESVIWDGGAYEGVFAREMAHKYGCTVHAFEPCRRFFEIAQATCREFDTVKLHHFALGSVTRALPLSVRGNSTGFFYESEETEKSNVIDVAALIDILDSPPTIDLLKLNIEGSEFEVLEHLLDTGRISRFKNIQVQFHMNVKDWTNRLTDIYSRLFVTHRHDWGEDPLFHQGFSLR